MVLNFACRHYVCRGMLKRVIYWITFSCYQNVINTLFRFSCSCSRMWYDVTIGVSRLSVYEHRVLMMVNLYFWQPTFGARVKCCLIHMALFSTRNFSYRVHKQQFVLKRRTHLVHCTYLPHYFVYTLDAFKYRHAYCAYGDQTRSFIFGKTSLGVSAQNLTAFIIVYFVTDTLDL